MLVLAPGFCLAELSPEDLPQIKELYAEHGWVLQSGKWDYLFRCHHLFGVFCKEELVATGGLHRSGEAPPVVIMIVVASSHFGKGLGTFVTQEAIRRADGAPCCLSATEMGRPLYEKLGFTTREYVSVYRSIFDTHTSIPEIPREGSREELGKLDSRAYGTTRLSLLDSLWERRHNFWIVERDGLVVGGALSFWEDDQLCVGPVYSGEGRLTQALVEKVTEGHEVVVHLRRAEEYLSWLNLNQAERCHHEPFMVQEGFEGLADDGLLAALPSFAYG